MGTHAPLSAKLQLKQCVTIKTFYSLHFTVKLIEGGAVGFFFLSEKGLIIYNFKRQHFEKHIPYLTKKELRRLMPL